MHQNEHLWIEERGGVSKVGTYEDLPDACGDQALADCGRVVALELVLECTKDVGSGKWLAKSSNVCFR